MGDLLVYVSVETLQQVLFFKHHAYRNEAEYRFLEVFPSTCSTVPQPYGLVRYLIRPARRGCESLRQIVIGPSATSIRARLSKGFSCHAAGCRRSSIPNSIPGRVTIVSSYKIRASSRGPRAQRVNSH